MRARAFGIALVSVLLILRTPAQASPPGLDAMQLHDVDAAVELVMMNDHVAGLTLGIARDTTPLYVHGYGMRDTDRALRAETETRYAIGSITKEFTAVAVLQLVASGKLALDAEISHELTVPSAWAHVTVAQLLAQTSGIPSYSDTPGFDATADRTPEQILGLVRDRPLEFTPGTQWSYSNTNYIVLGMIVAHASGESYDTYVGSQLLAPLGLRETTLGACTADECAHGYTWRDGRFTALAPASAGSTFSAAGLSSTASDLLTWTAALLDGHALDAAHSALMHTPIVLPDGSNTGYGFGEFVESMYARPVYVQSGFVDGFSSFAMSVPDTNLHIVVLANAQAADLAPLAKSIFAIVEPPSPALVPAVQ